MARRPGLPARPRTAAAFTLVEVLVALVIVAIVFGQILAIFSTQHRAYVAHERVVDIQQEARLVTELMLHDVRMAGFMSPPRSGIASRDGGTGGADVLCTSDPTVIAPVQLFNANGPFDRAFLQATVGAGATAATLVVADLDVDGDGNDDFDVGAGIILSDGSDSHCARLTAVSTATGQVQFTPATPAGFSVGTASGRATAAFIYELTAAGLTRNGLLVSPQVEDVQVEFAVDLDNDGAIDEGAGEFPIHDLHDTDSDPGLVRRVRLSVISRAPEPEEMASAQGLPAAANRAPGAADGYRRRRVTATAIPRNLL